MAKKKEIVDFIRDYHTPSCSNHVRRSKNAVFFNAGSTTKHELSKAVGGLMLLKWGDVMFTKGITDALHELSSCIDIAFGEFVKQKANFITECVPNNEGNRRVDLVNVDDNTRFEFETDHEVKKQDCVTIKI